MRPDRDTWALRMAALTAERSTCLRRAVGCVLTNSKGHVLATGYNGVAAGQRHCNEEVSEPLHGPEYEHILSGRITKRRDCIGFRPTFPHACAAAYAPSGTNLDGCEAIHAESNALLQCRDVYAIDTCYVTASPCINCVKLLLNTSCRKIVYRDDYPHSTAKELWERSGREWVKLDLPG